MFYVLTRSPFPVPRPWTAWCFAAGMWATITESASREDAEELAAAFLLAECQRYPGVSHEGDHRWRLSETGAAFVKRYSLAMREQQAPKAHITTTEAPRGFTYRVHVRTNGGKHVVEFGGHRTFRSRARAVDAAITVIHRRRVWALGNIEHRSGAAAA